MLAQDLTQIQIPSNVVVTGGNGGFTCNNSCRCYTSVPGRTDLALGGVAHPSAQRRRWIDPDSWWLGFILLIISTAILVINPFPYDVQFKLGSIAVFSLFLGGTLLIPSTVNVLERRYGLHEGHLWQQWATG